METARRPSSLAFSLVTVVFAVSYFLGSLEGDVQVKPGATVTVKTQNTAMQEWWDDDGLVWGDDDSDEANTAGAEDTSTPVAAEDTHESVPTPPQPASATMKPLSTEPRTPTEEPGFLKHPSYYSPVYLPRAREPVAETPWGSWDWEDPRNEHRVLDDAFYQQFPQRDVTEWPQNTWQTNTVYLSEFLKQSKALVERSMEAILHEYGHSNLQEPDRSFEERSEMFSLTFLNHGDKPPKYYMNSGWTTQLSFQGLQRRILHSILTEDTFVVAMGGHSAAAGHGNHFQQSYTLQVQRVLEPVFARLGVAMQARNFGMGGLGTLHNSLAAGSLYGPDVDLLIWDSGMTEKTPAHLEVFHRQGILGGDKVPVLWGQQTEWLMDHADVGDVSNKRDWKHMEKIIGFNVTTSAAQGAKLPWAERHVMCNNEMMSECRSKAYRGTCWIDRPDITPATKQKSAPGGRASWHPGDRVHAWQGRMIAFGILRALDAALDQWMKAPQYQLSPDAWHVADYYRGIKEKVQSLEGECQKEESFSSTFCSTPVKARSEFTPRYNPAATSIRTLIKDGVHIPKSHANQYDPLDVYNPNLDVPAGVFDVRAIPSDSCGSLIDCLSVNSRLCSDSTRLGEWYRLSSQPGSFATVSTRIGAILGFIDTVGTV